MQYLNRTLGLTLLFLLPLCLMGQRLLNKRVELQAGPQFTLLALGGGEGNNKARGLTLGAGYQTSLNFHFARTRMSNGRNWSFYIGLGLGYNRWSSDQFIRTETGRDRPDLGINRILTVATTRGDLEMSSRYVGYTFGLRVEVSMRLAVIVALQVRENQEGTITRRGRRELTHIYDPAQRLYLPLSQPLNTEFFEREFRGNRDTYQIGMEYRTLSGRCYVKGLIDLDASNRTVNFTTLGLQLLTGVRI